MHGWQANTERTCAQPVVFRAMPENEKPPAMRADIYFPSIASIASAIQLFAFANSNAAVSLSQPVF